MPSISTGRLCLLMILLTLYLIFSVAWFFLAIPHDPDRRSPAHDAQPGRAL